MKLKIYIKAVFWGFLVDIIGSLVIGFIIVIIAGNLYVAKGKNMDGFEQYFSSNLPIMLISLLVGLIFVILGGFISGTIAKQNELFNASLVGVIGILFGLLICWSLPLWYNIASFLLTIPCAYIGGLIAKKIKMSKESFHPDQRTQNYETQNYFGNIINKKINKKKKILPIELKIAAIYLIVVGVIGLVWPLLNIIPNHHEFQVKSVAYKAGAYFREIVFNVIFITSGIGLFIRKTWARRLALVVIPVSTIYSSTSFAWGFARGKPNLSTFIISFLIVGLWNAFWFYIIFRKKSKNALLSEKND